MTSVLYTKAGTKNFKIGISVLLGLASTKNIYHRLVKRVQSM
jgi:hypothetical protein